MRLELVPEFRRQRAPGFGAVMQDMTHRCLDALGDGMLAEIVRGQRHSSGLCFDAVERLVPRHPFGEIPPRDGPAPRREPEHDRHPAFSGTTLAGGVGGVVSSNTPRTSSSKWCLIKRP